MSNIASISIDLGELQNACFVVMPFSPLFSTQYERVIRPAVEDAGLICVRGDEIYTKSRIMDDIWQSIRSSRVIIAELTGKNPNVMYEIGLAHALGKAVIILTRNEDDVPFDLKALRYLFYDTGDPFWGQNLQTALKQMLLNVLSTKGLSDNLKGISELQKPEYPERSKPTKEGVKESDIISVAGIWQGTYENNSSQTHQAIMNLSQDGKNLTGVMTITFPEDDKMVTIQETLSGTIEGLVIALEGVNYTYLQKDESDGFLLETYSLKLAPDHTKMDGAVHDENGTYSVTLSRVAAAKKSKKSK